MSLRVFPVDTCARQTEFLLLAKAVCTGDPFCIPAAENVPQDGESFLVFDGSRPVARCCARLQTGNPGIGTIGAFHAFDHPPAAEALLATAAERLKACGARKIIGPMDGDTWHAYRFNTGPFDTPPFAREPWNPPYYPALWQRAGFAVMETYDSFLVDDPALAAAHQEKYHRRCLKNGYLFHPLTTANLIEFLPLLYDLSCRIFADNILYTPIRYETFQSLYLPARRLLAPGLSWIAYQRDGVPAGYVFTFPDFAAALRAMRGTTGPLAKLRFLLNKRRAFRSCIKTLGVIPEARGAGLAAALTHLSFANSVSLGYSQSLMCLMHSANPSRRLGGQADRPFRSYALYEYVK